MGLKDKFKLNDKTLKQDKKEEKPLIVSIDSNKENESKKSSLGMILFALIMGFIIGVVVCWVLVTKLAVGAVNEAVSLIAGITAASFV